MSIVTRILAKQGLISEADINVVNERELVSKGKVTEKQYARAVAISTQLDLVDLSTLEISDSVLNSVPDSLKRRHEVLPIKLENQVLTLAVVDPKNLSALDDVNSSGNFRDIKMVVAPRDEMEVALSKYVHTREEMSALATFLQDDQEGEKEVVLEADSNEPIVKFVNLLIRRAIEERASDIHIEPGEFNVEIRYRIDGVLHKIETTPKHLQDTIISRVKIMSGINIAEKRLPQDGRISLCFNNKTLDLRVATLPTIFGEKIVMRILDTSSLSFNLADSHFNEKNLKIYQKSFKKPNGLILVTGPTGSGKSTTLYTTLSAINSPEVNVITIEDPVEYKLAGINQIQVNHAANLSFAEALRSILRADPDVILVGEIRDKETARASIEASLTGHLVLSTLHTNDAPSALTRLTDMGIESFLVGSSVSVVVAQRLVRRLCSKCKKLSSRDLGEFSAVFSKNDAIYEKVGCKDCSYTGYNGRLAIHEVMEVSPEIEKLVSNKASSTDIKNQALVEGMIELREDGWEEVRKGNTSIEEVLRVVG